MRCAMKKDSSMRKSVGPTSLPDVWHVAFKQPMWIQPSGPRAPFSVGPIIEYQAGQA